MDPIYQKALNGTLKSPPSGSPMANVEFTNKTDIEVTLQWVGEAGEHVFYTTIGSQKSFTQSSATSGQYWMMTSSITGAFLCVFTLESNVTRYTVSNSLLTAPNDIGETPKPSSTLIIPPSSPNVMIGIGSDANGNLVTREQFWRRTSNSYSLASKETKVVRMSVTSGIDSTSSRLEEVSGTIGTSLGAGWGPVSASISASLSKTSNDFQSITLSEQKTVDVADTVTNPNAYDVVVFEWQLIDTINWIKEGKVVSSINSGEMPTIRATYPPPLNPGAGQVSTAPDETLLDTPRS